jgi:ATP-dependent Clp protease ATP-binding subunit ClpA
LFDEIEKAHPEIFNTLLQVLEDGRLTDAKGRTASFKNTILIMTSNIGSNYITQMGSLGFMANQDQDSRKNLKEKVIEALQEEFRPEFLNRVDETIIFNHLGQEEIRKIVDLEMAKVVERAKVSKRIELKATDQAKQFLAKKGFDPRLGARPLKRVIQRLILDPLALKIVSGEIISGSRILIDLQQISPNQGSQDSQGSQSNQGNQGNQIIFKNRSKSSQSGLSPAKQQATRQQAARHLASTKAKQLEQVSV